MPTDNGGLGLGGPREVPTPDELDALRDRAHSSLSAGIGAVLEEAGARLGQPYKFEAFVVPRGDRLSITRVRLSDVERADLGISTDVVGSMVLSELASVAIPEDRFVRVSLLVGMSGDMPEIQTIKVDRTDDRPIPEPVNPSYGEMDRLWEVVLAYRDKHEITCPETVYQTDKIAVTATDFIADCLKVVGYGRLDDETAEYVGGSENRVPEDEA